jgi:hypothetical protein
MLAVTGIRPVSGARPEHDHRPKQVPTMDTANRDTIWRTIAFTENPPMTTTTFYVEFSTIKQKEM